MSLISDPLFTANSTEELEAVDAYDVTDTRPVNKLWAAAVDKSEEMFERVGGIRGILEGATRIQESKERGLEGREMVDQVLGMFGHSSGGILQEVGGSILDKAATFLDLDPSTMDKVKTAGSQISHIVKHGDPTDVRQYGNLVGLIGDLSGNSQLAGYINIGYQGAIWASVLAETMGFDDYEYIDYLKREVDPEVYRQALIYSIPSVATSGRYEALQKLLQTLTEDEVVAEYPEFIPVFLRYFRLPDAGVPDMAVYVDTIVGTLTKMEADWYVHLSTEERTVYDMQYLTDLSADGRHAFSVHPILGPLVQMAPHYPESPVEQIIRQDFPMMVTTLA